MRIVLDRLAAVRAIPLAEFLRAHPLVVERKPTDTITADLIPTPGLKHLPAVLAYLFFYHFRRVRTSLADIIARMPTGVTAIYMLVVFADEGLPAPGTCCFRPQN